MLRRPHLLPWQAAGRVTDEQETADDVVLATGWVFDSRRGEHLTLSDFVASGSDEVSMYLDLLGLSTDDDAARSIVEIGSGIGRMTCAFTRRFGAVYACDLDAGFLERCREVVARFGIVDRLRTVPVPDGRTLDLPDGVADIVFSYITLQHCSRDEAARLVGEAVRVARPGGRIALDFRARSWMDCLVLPLGALVRASFNIPWVGVRLSRRPLPARLAWQVNRRYPHQVVGQVAGALADITIWRHPRKTAPLWGVDRAGLRYLDAVNPAHWWLVATKRSDADTGTASADHGVAS